MQPHITLLCIHRDPAQLSVLGQNGFNLITATNGHDGLQIFRSRPVDAVVLDDKVGLLGGSVMAAEIRKVNPLVPIVLLADVAKLPHPAVRSVDALVANSDGPRSLLATVHFLLNANHGRSQEPGNGPDTQEKTNERELRHNATVLAAAENKAPFSPAVWRSIWDGTIQF